jgi:hypothetical protein
MIESKLLDHFQIKLRDQRRSLSALCITDNYIAIKVFDAFLKQHGDIYVHSYSFSDISEYGVQAGTFRMRATILISRKHGVAYKWYTPASLCANGSAAWVFRDIVRKVTALPSIRKEVGMHYMIGVST